MFRCYSEFLLWKTSLNEIYIISYTYDSSSMQKLLPSKVRKTILKNTYHISMHKDNIKAFNLA